MTDRHIAGIAVRNPQIVAVGHYYGVTIATCVPADPESKGRVGIDGQVGGRVGLIDAGQHRPAQQGVIVVESARQGIPQLGDLGRFRPLAISANTAGSRCPTINASIICRPDWVNTDDATDDNLTPASSRTLCNPYVSRPRSSITDLR